MFMKKSREPASDVRHRVIRHFSLVCVKSADKKLMQLIRGLEIKSSSAITWPCFTPVTH